MSDGEVDVRVNFKNATKNLCYIIFMKQTAIRVSEITF